MREAATRTLGEFEAEAAAVAAGLAPRTDRATLVMLSGELGAGKTAFVKAVAKALGVGEPVTSPTFVLEKIYRLPPKVGHPMSDFRRLVHIDAYRLDGAAELAALGFDELMADPGNLILLEWPERVGLDGGAADPVMHIAFAANPDGTHTISYA